MTVMDDLSRWAEMARRARAELETQRSLLLHQLDVELGIPARFNEHGQLVVTQQQWYAMRREFMSSSPPTCAESLSSISVVIDNDPKPTEQ